MARNDAAGNPADAGRGAGRLRQQLSLAGAAPCPAAVLSADTQEFRPAAKQAPRQARGAAFRGQSSSERKRQRPGDRCGPRPATRSTGGGPLGPGCPPGSDLMSSQEPYRQLRLAIAHGMEGRTCPPQIALTDFGEVIRCDIPRRPPGGLARSACSISPGACRRRAAGNHQSYPGLLFPARTHHDPTVRSRPLPGREEAAKHDRVSNDRRRRSGWHRHPG